MHAEIAAAVAREQLPGLSQAAAARLEELLGRPATVIELEVGAALLRTGVLAAAPRTLPRLPLGSGRPVVLAVARGEGAVLAAAVELGAAGAAPQGVALLATAPSGSPADQADAAALELPLSTLPRAAVDPALVLAVGFGGGRARVLAAGDVLIYLGAPTGRSGGLALSPLPPASAEMPADLRALLRTLSRKPGLLLAVRWLRAGGLAQAAASLAVGTQLVLDAVPRQPASMRPTEILLAEAPPRALLVVPAERVDEVLAAAQAAAVGAAAIGVVAAEPRLRALMKPPGGPAARLVCELPLAALVGAAAPAEGPAAERSSAVPPIDGGELAVTLHKQLARPDLPGPAAAWPGDETALVLSAAPLPAASTAWSEAQSAALRAVRATGASPVGTFVLLPLHAAAVEAEPGAAVAGLPMASLHAAEVSGPGWAVALGEAGAGAPLVGAHFPGPGQLIAVLGFEDTEPPHEDATHALCHELIAAGLCTAARPIGDGGLLAALSHACAGGDVGCTAVLPGPQALSAGGCRYLLAIPAPRQADARLLAAERAVPLWPLGRTGGRELLVRYGDGPPESPFKEVLRIAVAALRSPPR
jgi:hypothetical protein